MPGRRFRPRCCPESSSPSSPPRPEERGWVWRSPAISPGPTVASSRSPRTSKTTSVSACGCPRRTPPRPQPCPRRNERKMARILIVDDEPHMRRILASNLRQDKHEIAEASGVEEARATLGGNDFDVVFTDQRMPDGEGLEVLAAVRENDSTIPVIMLTALASIELAVESMRQGAFDFLTKPFQPEVVRAAANRAAQHAR